MKYLITFLAGAAASALYLLYGQQWLVEFTEKF